MPAFFKNYDEFTEESLFWTNRPLLFCFHSEETLDTESKDGFFRKAQSGKGTKLFSFPRHIVDSRAGVSSRFPGSASLAAIPPNLFSCLDAFYSLIQPARLFTLTHFRAPTARNEQDC